VHQRLRFSAAHELGHLFLHKDVYGSLNFTTVKEWIRFINAIPILQYHWIERHADEFAGQILMPTHKLSAALDETMSDAEREGILGFGREEVLEFCCRAMHNDFDVSFQAMQTRIRKSQLWPHKKLPEENPNWDTAGGALHLTL
jgi:Zn-dependent peptidase ImmA (M78 family)